MRRTDPRWIAAVAIWALVVGGGMVWLVAYKSAPGAEARAPSEWPAESRLTRAEGRPTLVMLAHPKCVCTRASLSELAVLLSRVEQKLAVYVLFLRPPDVAFEGWTDSDTWRSAQELPGATVLEDLGGVEARRFGAETSGQVVIYDEAGRLLFRGGLTGLRGHEGDNAGLRRAIALVSGQKAERDSSPVFGCALDDPNPKGETTE